MQKGPAVVVENPRKHPPKYLIFRRFLLPKDISVISKYPKKIPENITNKI